MINDFSKIFIKARLEALAKSNNANFLNLFSYVTKPITRINDNASFIENYTINEVRNLFNAGEERVFIRDFESGLRPDYADTLFSSIVSIGRNQTILDMLNGNKASLIKSLENSQLTMIEINGKLYAENDGNHRLMALKILYYLEKSKNFSFDEKNFSFVTRVKHLNHSKELIDSVVRLTKTQNTSLFHDYLTAKIPYSDTIYNIIKFDKETKTYEISFQGKKYRNLNEKQAVTLLGSLKYDKPYSVYKMADGYALEFGNMLIECKTGEKLQNAIKNLNLEKTVFSNDYKVIKKENSYDLIINAKRYYDSVENLKKIYSACVNFNQNELIQVTETEANCPILNDEQIKKVYFKNLDIVDVELSGDMPFVQINERTFENITKAELDKRINQLKKERMFCKEDNFTLATKTKNLEQNF